MSRGAYILEIRRFLILYTVSLDMLNNYLSNCRFHTRVEESILGWEKVILSLRGHLKTKLETIIL